MAAERVAGTALPAEKSTIIKGWLGIKNRRPVRERRKSRKRKLDSRAARVLIDHQEIDERVGELARLITEDYRDRDLVVVGILKGAFVFLADLVRRVDLPLEVDFVAVSSYGKDTVTSGVVRVIKDLDLDIRGRDVLLVEDIVDTGLTLDYIARMLLQREPASLEICALLNKPEARKVDIEVKYCGFDIPPVFVVGYGLDYAERYRQLPYVGVLEEAPGTADED